MRKLSLYAFFSFVALWGINLYILHDKEFTPPKIAKAKKTTREVAAVNTEKKEEQISEDPLTQKNYGNLEKIGDVINEKTAKIDDSTREQIKRDKVRFDNEENVKEKVVLLEQSFLDKNSSVKDIKRLQADIQDSKNKLKMEVNNTEKWDPMFVYYLMIQENYTYGEINQIKSLSENGISNEELNYINELVKEESFKKQVLGYKNHGEIGRVVASFKRSGPKEKDEFVDNKEVTSSAEEKLIEMNYGQQ